MPDPGPVSVVVGGTSGIGAAIARRLAEPGASIVLAHLENTARARAVAAELEPRVRAVRIVQGNVADAATRREIAAAVASLGGRCDHLVHSVAVTNFKPLLRVRPNQWNLVFEVSARSLPDLVAELLESLAAARGRIVAISSQGAARHVPSYGALGPAKAALEAAVRQLAVELAPHGVRINAVRAGLIDGEAARLLPPEVRDAVARRTPGGRLASAGQVADVAHFLLGDGASGVLGQVIEVDGGFSLV